MKLNLQASLAGTIVCGTVLSAQTTFSTANLGVGIEPEGLALFDLEGDGDLDLAVTVDAPDRIEIYSNNAGAFTFSSSILAPQSSSPHSLVAADFDRDGDRDLAVSLQDLNQVHVHANQGGTFLFAGSFATGLEPRDLLAADVNADGFVDLVSSNRDGNSLTVAYSSAGVFGASQTIAAGNEPREVASGDLDGNGSNDIAVAIHDDRLVRIFTSAGGSLTPTASLSTGFQLRPEGVAVADTNGDGLLDVMATTSGNGLNSLSVWLGTGAGAFGLRTDYPVGGQDPGALVAADLDGDGDVDAATVNEDSNSVSLLVNQGTGLFLASGAMTTGGGPTSLVQGDANNDGGIDLFVANDLGNSVTQMTNATSQPVSLLVEPFVGSTGVVQMYLPAHAGENVFCGFSRTDSGFVVPGGVFVPLGIDFNFIDSLNSSAGAFRETIGTLDGSGRAQSRILVPPVQTFAGFRIHAAVLTLGTSTNPSFGAAYGPIEIVAQ